ncbi:MAG: hypothetical protein FJZ85_09705, partial [Chloroflexi bacterium]|nr:hypothetical protein [Chloroflexota bacterium]
KGVVTEKWVVTSCLNCPTRCATKVRVVNGRAVRIAENQLSKVSEGKLCPRSHVGLQVLYDPDRAKSPLKRTNPQKGKDVDPGWVPVSWDEGVGEINRRLQGLRDRDEAHKLAVFCGLNSISNDDLIRRFAGAYGTPNIVTDDSLGNEAEKSGQWMADGNYVHSAYDLERTNYILSFGASVVESQKPLARNLRMWGKIRRERPNRAKVVVIDPRYSVTAAKADLWIPIKPGTDGALALAMANVIISEELYDANFVNNWTSGFDQYKELVLSQYAPERMAEITGVSADVIRRIAAEFAQTKPAIAWRGRGATCWPDGSYASFAIFCLNALVGSIDVPGGVIYQEYPSYREMPAIAEDRIAKAGKAKPSLGSNREGRVPVAGVSANQVADSILKGNPYPVEVAIGYNSNFNMLAPGSGRWDEAMAKLPFYVHVAPSITEMATFADIVLPACTFLEEWGYDHCPPGSGFAEMKIKQPAVERLYDSLSIADIIFGLAKRLGGAVAQSFDGTGDDAEGFVRYRTGTVMPWDEFRGQGVWVGAKYEFYKYDRVFKTPSKKFEFYSANMEAVLRSSDSTSCLPHYKEAKFLGDEKTYPLMLSTYAPLLDIENGNQNYPWAQEIYMVLHGQGWSNFVEMNSETAHGLGIKDGDMVWVESSFGKVKGKARVFQGIHPGVVAIANGQGHWACGRWAKGMGINPNSILGVDYDRLSGQSTFFNTRVKVYKA